jgi:hypothetical protein
MRQGCGSSKGCRNIFIKFVINIRLRAFLGRLENFFWFSWPDLETSGVLGCEIEPNFMMCECGRFSCQNYGICIESARIVVIIGTFIYAFCEALLMFLAPEPWQLQVSCHIFLANTRRECSAE